MAKMILDAVTRTSIERRIALSAGDKVKGEIDIMGSHIRFSLFERPERERITMPGEWYFVRISRFVERPQGIGREVVYERDIALGPLPLQVSFEAPKDGEYLVEIEIKGWIEELCVRARLFLEG